jgi:replicative DNA helicase
VNTQYAFLNKDEAVPYNLIIEKTIIAEILLNKESLATIFYKVKIDFFYSQNYQYIFKASKELYEERIEINLDTISDRLKLTGHLNIIGGVEGLVTLINTIIVTNDIETYIVLLIDKYIRRQIVYGAIKIQRLAYQQFDSIETLFDEAEKILFSITQEKPSSNLLLTSEVLLETFIDLEKRSLENQYSGIKTGFFDLDEITQGFQKSDLIIIAGRPSMGKTAFALNLVRNVSELQDSPVIVFSLEMSRQQLIYRFLSKESQVMHSKLRTGDINKKEWYSISKAITILASLKIYLDDTPNLSLISMRNKINSLQIIHGDIGMIVLDYLQLLNDPRNKDSRVQELSRLTRGLKILAKEFDTPILVLSQLSRNVESRVNKRPLLSDLRESGCITGNMSLYVPCKNSYFKIQKITNNKNIYSLLSSIKEQKLKNFFCQIATLKRAYYTGIKFIYKLETVNKNVLKITATHKIFTLKGWVKVSKIKPKHLICVLDLKNFPKVFHSKTSLNNNRYYPDLSFVGIAKINFCGSNECYDLWVPFTNNYTSNNIVIHNSIEQDADLVLMLYRDSYYDDELKTEENNITEVILTKHRNGPIGTINILFEPRTLTFDNFIF